MAVFIMYFVMLGNIGFTSVCSACSWLFPNYVCVLIILTRGPFCYSMSHTNGTQSKHIWLPIPFKVFFTQCTSIFFQKFLKIINFFYSIWRVTPGDKAGVPATKLSFTYRISILSFPHQSCCSQIQKMLPLEIWRHIVSGATDMERDREGRNPIRARQLCSGDVGFFT